MNDHLPEPPKPNTQAISWFYGEYKKEALLLSPKYQRNPIWSIGQKCFLIDSILSGCPLPQVFLNIKIEGVGTKRKTLYEVVDGQQRLRAILEFLADEWPLISTTAKSYPVSDAYKPHIGKRYSELNASLQEQIWNYPLSVQELRSWGDTQIRALFRRLNYVVEKLNAQELRHSQYFGEFVTAVEKLAEDGFWDEIGLFTRRDSQRMKDVEFVSELFLIVIDGIQDQQKTIDKFYADFDVVFSGKAARLREFKRVVDSLKSIADVVSETRFKKKADFYGLFSAIAAMTEGLDKELDLSDRAQKLRELDRQLLKEPEDMPPEVARYYSTVIEGANKLAKRQERSIILQNLLM
jgi:hypothetical protein